LGYYDRAESRILAVPLKEVTFPEDSAQTFQLTDLIALAASPLQPVPWAAVWDPQGRSARGPF
jgi:hypothetical protein